MATEVQGTQKNAVKLIFIAAAVIVGLWFGYIIMPILFFLFFAIVLTLVLNAPVMWLTKKGWNRTLASVAVFLVLLLFLGLIG